MLGESALGETALGESVPIKPAKTPRGRANQLAQMLAHVPEIRARGYGSLVETIIEQLRSGGNPGKERKRVEKYLAENPEVKATVLALIAEGKTRPAAKIRKRIAVETNASLQTVDRVLFQK